MPTITNGINESRKAGVKGLLRHHPKTDMTPMVDLGFLLITFFVITTRLSQPFATPLYMSKDGDPMPAGESTALTLLLGKDNTVYYYSGQWDNARQKQQVLKTGYSPANGISDVIAVKQQWMDQWSHSDSGRNQMMLLIKAGPDARYEQVVRAMDEAIIHRVKRYVLMSPDKEETKWLTRQ